MSTSLQACDTAFQGVVWESTVRVHEWGTQSTIYRYLYRTLAALSAWRDAELIARQCIFSNTGRRVRAAKGTCGGTEK
jgi:hypothetical protein